MDVVKGDSRIALTPEIDCKKTAMGCHVMSAVFLIAN
jgi:hypothetical protein